MPFRHNSEYVSTKSYNNNASEINCIIKLSAWKLVLKAAIFFLTEKVEYLTREHLCHNVAHAGLSLFIWSETKERGVINVLCKDTHAKSSQIYTGHVGRIVYYHATGGYMTFVMNSNICAAWGVFRRPVVVLEK